MNYVFAFPVIRSAQYLESEKGRWRLESHDAMNAFSRAAIELKYDTSGRGDATCPHRLSRQGLSLPRPALHAAPACGTRSGLRSGEEGRVAERVILRKPDFASLLTEVRTRAPRVTVPHRLGRPGLHGVPRQLAKFIHSVERKIFTLRSETHIECPQQLQLTQNKIRDESHIHRSLIFRLLTQPRYGTHDHLYNSH